MPRVTVIMATYNWSTVLPHSIGSVLRQTFTDPRVQWINIPRTGHQSGPNTARGAATRSRSTASSAIRDI